MARKIVKCIYPTGEDATAGIEIDAFLSETYSFSNKITDKPSEGDTQSGTGTVTDEGDELSVEAFIGATKFEVVQSAPPSSLADADIPDEYPFDRVTSAFEELKRLKETKQPMDIVTGLTTMSGMVIESLEITRDESTGADLSFTCTFKKAPVTASGATPATEQAQGVVNTGKSGTEQPKENFITKRANEWNERGMMTDSERSAFKTSTGL